MTPKERAKVVADLIANPDKHLDEADARARKENPKLTPKQLAKAREHVKKTLGI